MKNVKYIVIHCSESPNGRNDGVRDVDQWHSTRFNRKPRDIAKFNSHLKHIGYQAVGRIDGTIESGRADEEIGAHAAGYNSVSLGYMLFGIDKFTQAQWDALANWLNLKLDDYPDAEVVGHYALNKHKTCPNFDVEAYVQNDFEPDPEHILCL